MLAPSGYGGLGDAGCSVPVSVPPRRLGAGLWPTLVPGTAEDWALTAPRWLGGIVRNITTSLFNLVVNFVLCVSNQCFCLYFILFHVYWLSCEEVSLHSRIDMTVSSWFHFKLFSSKFKNVLVWMFSSVSRVQCCAMARYYQLIIFTGMKYQYQAGRPLLFSLSKWSENDIQSLDRYEYEGGRSEIFTKEHAIYRLDHGCVFKAPSQLKHLVFSYKYF